MGGVTVNAGMASAERSGDAAAPLRRVPLYAQAEKVLEDLLVHRRYRVGDRIPPEVELVKSLGVQGHPAQRGGSIAGPFRTRHAGVFRHTPHAKEL